MRNTISSRFSIIYYYSSKLNNTDNVQKNPNPPTQGVTSPIKGVKNFKYLFLKSFVKKFLILAPLLVSARDGNLSPFINSQGKKINIPIRSVKPKSSNAKMTNANPHKSRKKAMGSIIRVSGVGLILNIVYKLYRIIKREARKYPFCNLFILKI